jgi:hypothetical protein
LRERQWQDGFTKEIEYMDFPADKVTLWFTKGKRIMRPAMSQPKFIDIDGKRYLWRYLLQLRREQLKACTCAGRYQEPSVSLLQRTLPQKSGRFALPRCDAARPAYFWEDNPLFEPGSSPMLGLLVCTRWSPQLYDSTISF